MLDGHFAVLPPAAAAAAAAALLLVVPSTLRLFNLSLNQTPLGELSAVLSGHFAAGLAVDDSLGSALLCVCSTHCALLFLSLGHVWRVHYCYWQLGCANWFCLVVASN